MDLKAFFIEKKNLRLVLLCAAVLIVLISSLAIVLPIFQKKPPEKTTLIPSPAKTINQTNDETSHSDGSYITSFDTNICNIGNKLEVDAVSGSLSGHNEGIINGANKEDPVLHSLTQDMDVALMDVFLIPEFGLFIGGLTIVSAIGIFFFVRRK